MQESFNENLKIALILRTIRGTLGLSQTKFAEFMNLPKSTITRAENLELPLKVDVYFRILSVAKEMGLELDALAEEPVIKLTKTFIEKEKEKKIMDNANSNH